MNHSITNSLSALLLIVIGLVGCSQETELPHTPDATRQALTISVVDGGYAPGDKSHTHTTESGYMAGNRVSDKTRAMDNGYTTTFTVGDKIGLYAVKNGEIVAANICLTAADNGNGGVSWTGDAYYEGADATYFAYYPYQATVNGTLTPSAKDAAGFFADVVSAWTPATDQSTYAKYTAQDLMVGIGILGSKPTEGTYPLVFAMTHTMALVVIEIPVMKYVFDNPSPTNSDYYALNPDTKFYEFTPYSPSVGSTYRLLVKPGQSGANDLVGSYITDNGNGNVKEYAINPNNLIGANYFHNKVDNASVTVKSHTLQAGDFYMNGGSLVSKDAVLTDAQKAACIGIVYWVGDATANDQTLAADHPGCTHGLVVAIKGSREVEWRLTNSRILDGNVSNILGYNNTKICEEYHVASSKIKPVVEAVAYRSSVPAPPNSSDWYVPSVKELTLLCGEDVDPIEDGISVGTANRDLINSKLKSMGAAEMLSSYWSSSENKVKAYYVNFSSGKVVSAAKNTRNATLFSLAF